MIIDWSILMFAAYAVLMLACYSVDRQMRFVPGILLTLLFIWLGCISEDIFALIPTVVLLVVSFVCHRNKARWRIFLSGCGTVLALQVACRMPRMLEIAALLDEYPPESLVERTTPRKTSYEPLSLPESTLTREQLELTKDEHQAIFEAHGRRKSRFLLFQRKANLSALSGLHSRALKVFADTPGFGVTRVRRMPIRRSRIELPELPVLPLPMSHEDAAASRPKDLGYRWVPGFPGGTTPMDARLLHLINVSDFQNPEGFVWIPTPGGIPDRSHAVGFQSHGFREPPADLPGKSVTWQVVRLDLVSLWLNDPPAVYVSDNLPKMGELSTAPTRALDPFEVTALKEIAAEQELVTAHYNADAIRMLGAIRATQECLNCHGVKLGHLLGAFSYDLRRGDRIESRE